MRWDPFTLVVVISNDGKAEGTLYLDDGESFEYRDGAFIHRKFTFSSSSSAPNSFRLTSTPLSRSSSKASIAYQKKMENIRVEKIVLVNVPGAWEGKSEVKVMEEGKGEKRVEFRYENKEGRRAAWAVVRDPGVTVGRGWEVKF